MEMGRKDFLKEKGFKNWGEACVKQGKEEVGEREKIGGENEGKKRNKRGKERKKLKRNRKRN